MPYTFAIDNLIEKVEDAWMELMMGELGIRAQPDHSDAAYRRGDPLLEAIIWAAAAYIIHQRDMLNAREEDCLPIPEQIVHAISALTSPEWNGA